MSEGRASRWYLLTGLLIGLGIGLAVSLLLMPVQYTDTNPAALSAAERADYRQLAALAYGANPNLARANGRLALLGDPDPLRELAAQAQRILAEGGSPDDARALALLASDLSGVSGIAIVTATRGSSIPEVEVTTESTSERPGETQPSEGAPSDGESTVTGTPQVATSIPSGGDATPSGGGATATPWPTFTPRPSATPPRVLDAPFTLASRVQVCDSSLPPGRLAVLVTGRDGEPLAGVPLLVTWGEGQSSAFYTGLAPEISLGYADFQMTEGVEYSLKVGEVSEIVTGLEVPACGGGWRVEMEEGR